jgi:hypothetical protein
VWITRKTDYATRAVLTLALAGEETLLKLDEIAERAAIPRPFLEQIMTQLRGDGIVRSERGPSGGYRLNHPGRDHAGTHRPPVPGPAGADRLRHQNQPRGVPDGGRVRAAGDLGGRA